MFNPWPGIYPAGVISSVRCHMRDICEHMSYAVWVICGTYAGICHDICGHMSYAVVIDVWAHIHFKFMSLWHSCKDMFAVCVCVCVCVCVWLCARVCVCTPVLESQRIRMSYAGACTAYVICGSVRGICHMRGAYAGICHMRTQLMLNQPNVEPD